MSRKTTLTWLIVAAVIAATWLAGHALLGGKPPPRYLEAPAVIGDIEESVLATGTLHPVEQVVIGAQVSGQIKSIYVKAGDHVKRDQLLAEIDPVLQQNALRSAQAQLASAQAQRDTKLALLKQYDRELARQRYMVGHDASSRANYEAALGNVETTRADLRAAQAQIVVSTIQVDNARAQLSYTRITAPMDGEVIAMVAQPGQTVVSAQIVPALMILGNTDTMTVRTRISEADVLRVKPGLPVHFSVLGEPDASYASQVRTIEPAPESVINQSLPQQYQQPESTTTAAVYYNGLFDVQNPAHKLRTSMTAQVSIVLGRAQQALTIPRAALGRQLGGGRYEVRVLDKDGNPQRREIRVGLLSETSAQVLDGLAAAERLVVGDAAAQPGTPTQTQSGAPAAGNGERS